VTAVRTAEALHAPLIVLPDCGHVPYVEAPQAFVAALDPFLPRVADV
jgi:pimeloyl-ACP methyl ester carboxylesterase